MERWRRWRRTVGVEITPVEGTNREITVTITDKTEQNFLDLEAFSYNIARERRDNRFKAATSLVLTAAAAIEGLRIASPLIPQDPDLLSNNQTLQILNQLGLFAERAGPFLESPPAVCAIAAIGAYYLYKTASRDKVKTNASKDGLKRTSISPTNLRVSPIDPPQPPANPPPANPSPPTP